MEEEEEEEDEEKRAFGMDDGRVMDAGTLLAIDFLMDFTAADAVATTAEDDDDDDLDDADDDVASVRCFIERNPSH